MKEIERSNAAGQSPVGVVSAADDINRRAPRRRVNAAFAAQPQNQETGHPGPGLSHQPRRLRQRRPVADEPGQQRSVIPAPRNPPLQRPARAVALGRIPAVEPLNPGTVPKRAEQRRLRSQQNAVISGAARPPDAQPVQPGQIEAGQPQGGIGIAQIPGDAA